MILSDVSIKRPVFATVISLLIVVFGISALMKLPVREYPDIDPPRYRWRWSTRGGAGGHRYSDHSGHRRGHRRRGRRAPH